MRGCLRSGDTPARLGGDEFAVLLEDAPDTQAVIEVAERILDALHEPIVIEGREVYARASIGIATRLGPTTTPDELLRNADLAMYTAKANGKGCIEMFEPAMHHRAVDRLAIRGELERAVQQRRHRRGLPADRAPRLGGGRGVRGAGAVGPPRAGSGPAGRVRAHRRGHRADRAARPARARAGLRAARAGGWPPTRQPPGR